MGDADPGQDEEARIDHDLMEVGDPFLSVPAEISVPCTDVAGSDAPSDARDWPAARECDVFEVFADGPGIAQVMVFLYKRSYRVSLKGVRRTMRKRQRRESREDIAGGIVDLYPRRWFSGSSQAM